MMRRWESDFMMISVVSEKILKLKNMIEKTNKHRLESQFVILNIYYLKDNLTNTAAGGSVP